METNISKPKKEDKDFATGSVLRESGRQRFRSDAERCEGAPDPSVDDVAFNPWKRNKTLTQVVKLLHCHVAVFHC